MKHEFDRQEIVARIRDVEHGRTTHLEDQLVERLEWVEDEVRRLRALVERQFFGEVSG